MIKYFGRKKSAFTLVEIIIVVIIIGILAGLAIANYGSILDRARVAEAKSVLMHGYAGYQRLLFDKEPIDGGNRLNWSRMGMTDPSTMANRYFDYTIRPNTASPTTLRATLIRDTNKYVEVFLSNGCLTLVNF